jgi:hypothetical protein
MVSLVVTGKHVHFRSSFQSEREAELAARRLIDAHHFTRELELRRLGYPVKTAAQLAPSLAEPLRVRLVDGADARRRAA